MFELLIGLSAIIISILFSYQVIQQAITKEKKENKVYSYKGV